MRWRQRSTTNFCIRLRCYGLRARRRRRSYGVVDHRIHPSAAYQLAFTGGGVARRISVSPTFCITGSGLLLLTVPVLAAFLVSGFFSLAFEYVLESLEKMRTRRTLERYVSKNLVKEILDNPGSFYNTLKGVRKPATMLFSDIIGFTTLTENADPEKLVVQLNEYLTRMVAVVFENEGTLDKFIGDAVMAVWGNARSAGVENDAKMAARAALGMRRELKLLNDRWKTEGTNPLGIGIGINQGEVLVGNIGSSERADLTVIGDAVNLASRLEGLTRTYGVDILLGANVTELVRDEFQVRSVALVQVKGKTKPVEISALLGARNESFDQEFLKSAGVVRRGDAKISLTGFHRRENSPLAIPRNISERRPRSLVSYARTGIRNSTARRELDGGRDLPKEVIELSANQFVRALQSFRWRNLRAQRKEPRVTGQPRSFHFLGICGTAMGSVAAALRDRGFIVTGSDANIYPPMSTFLAQRGIALNEGFRAENIPSDTDVVVIGNAMTRGNPEVEAVLNQPALLPGAARSAETILPARPQEPGRHRNSRKNDHDRVADLDHEIGWARTELYDRRYSQEPWARRLLQ